MKKKGLILALLIVLFGSCNKIIETTSSLSKDTTKLEDFKTIKVNEQYSISVPNYMSELKSLNDDASFEYANIFKDVYTIVIDEDKEEFINTFKELEMYDTIKSPLTNYTEFQLKTFQENIENLNYKEIPSTNNQLKQYLFNGKVDELKISYLIGFYEGNKNMYLLMSWTQTNKFNKYEDTFKKIHSTFKLLP